MNEDLTTLRRRAAHCRRLANLIYDRKVVTELLMFAADLDMEVEKQEREAGERRSRAA